MNDAPLQSSPRPGPYRWWHAAIFFVAVNAFARLTGGDNAIYTDFRQAPFAPPSWVFPIAWTINNVLVLWGNLRLLNLRVGTRRRRTLIALQAISWAIYATFSFVYFNLGSPVLCLAWTAGMFVLTLASMSLAWRVDRTITWSMITLALWLALATPVATYQALYNPDPFLRTSAPTTPQAAPSARAV